MINWETPLNPGEEFDPIARLVSRSELGIRLRAIRLEIYGQHGAPMLASVLGLSSRAWLEAEAQGDLAAEAMLRFDLDNENQTIRSYRDRVRQCESLGEYALAEQIREILVQEQEHQMDLATALGVDVPDVSKPDERA